ncbi:MAG: GNAT family N-acetyltransferase, partial [Pseudomonadota bacterium]
RRFGLGRVLGPVVARDAGTARRLMAAAALRCEGSFLRIDLPEAAGLDDTAKALGLVHAGGGVAMTRDAHPPRERRHETFALVSQALG